MSDLSSEESGEWVVLNEDDELSVDNVEEQPLTLQLSYDAVCDAVSESIRSSFSSEELEWQYEQFQDFIPCYRSSGIEELDYHELDTDFTEDLDVSHSEKHDSSKCDFEDDKSVKVSSVSKRCCYKHTRNDHVNFVLNLMLALVLASAVGLGIGHFLGWSHKCYKSTSVRKSASGLPGGVFHSSQLPEAISVMQNVENILDQENKVIDPIPFSENLSDISCWDHKNGGSSMHQEVCISHMNNDIAVDAVPETSILISEDVRELKTGEMNKNNISQIGLSLVSSIVTQIDWNKTDPVTELFKNFDEHLEESNTQEMPSIETEKLISEKIFPFGLREILLSDTEKSISEETSSFSSDTLRSEGSVNDVKTELLKQVYIKDNTYKESNLTNQLREDISQVIQSLSALALARLTHVTDNDPLLVENSGLIVKYYRNFENLVNLKLSEIDNFVMSTEYKRYEKASLKHVQKMIYSLIDSIDHLMKTSFKTLNRNNRQINVHKFLNNISKVIFTFNKRWEKNSSNWFQIVGKLKFREIKFQEKSFKKENKYWRRKYPFEKENKSNKYQRFSMKS